MKEITVSALAIASIIGLIAYASTFTLLAGERQTTAADWEYVQSPRTGRCYEIWSDFHRGVRIAGMAQIPCSETK